MDIYRKYFLILLFLLFLPLFVNAQVSKIVFTTEPQTIKINELSGSITIQTQDSSGNSYKTPETIDLEFISTSSTGEFLGSTGNPATKTMSTNTSNRTFYYRDSSFGSFTLTVNAKGRTSSTVWNATQTITMSNSVSTTTATTTSNITSTPFTTTSSGATLNTSTMTISTHYSAAPLTNIETDIKFEIGAGRPRMSIVGAPIEFNANTNAGYTKNIDFKWSFGDGTTGVGQILTHTYVYPGEYVAVLNATSPDGMAVSRTNVSVIPADLSLVAIEPSRIEIINKSSREVNLYGRALIAQGKIFAFPKDTIIKAGQKISFGANTTGLNLSGQPNVSLVVVGTEIRPQEVMAKMEEEKKKEIGRISAELSILRSELAKLETQERSINVAKVETVNKEEKEEISQTALVIESVNNIKLPKKISWLETLKHFLFRTQ